MSVKLILSKIEQHEDISDDLENINFNVLDVGRSRKLTYHLLHKCFLSKNQKACVNIIDILNLTRVDPLPAITNLYLNPFLNDNVDLISFVMSCFPNKSVSDYYVELINLGNDDDAVTIAKKMLLVFSNIEHKVWDYLYYLTEDYEEEEYDNYQLRDFFKLKVGETNPDIIIPTWIKIGLPEKELPTIPSNLPSVKEAVEILLDEFRKSKIKIDNLGAIRKTMISQYAICTINEKIAMLKGLIDLPKFDETSIFQEFGPVNTIYNHYNHDHDNSDYTKYGGCRMLLCNEFEDCDVDGYQVDLLNEHDSKINWFRNKCDICYNNICAQHHALRLPLLHGGWKGCYCSFECMKQDIDDPCTALMVGRMKEQLETFGIRDR